jgi:hypothetical protein
LGKIVTLREAYIYAFAFLEGYWESTHNRNLGDILSGMTLWHPLSRDEKPADRASQQDWLNAVRKVTECDSLTNTQALQAAYYFLKEYDHQGLDLKKPLAFLKDKLDKQAAAEKTWKRSRLAN